MFYLVKFVQGFRQIMKFKLLLLVFMAVLLINVIPSIMVIAFIRSNWEVLEWYLKMKSLIIIILITIPVISTVGFLAAAGYVFKQYFNKNLIYSARLLSITNEVACSIEKSEYDKLNPLLDRLKSEINDKMDEEQP